jgi:14-3-3 protein epsilon
MLQDFEKTTLRAKAAQLAEDWDDMAKYMKARCEEDGHLLPQDRDLLSIAFKNSVDSRRHALRIAAATEEMAWKQSRADNDKEKIARAYRKKVEDEVIKQCEDFIHLLKSKLLPIAERGEAKVFYLKLMGDFCRYKIEAARDAEAKLKLTEAATETYDEALVEAKAHLLDTHPLRLGLALNYAVFQHTVLRDRDQAIRTAKAALYGAKKDLISLPEEAQRDTEELCISLQENVSNWESDIHDEAIRELQRQQMERRMSERGNEMDDAESYL